MNSKRGYFARAARRAAAAAPAAILGGCLLGPWNLAPQDQPAKVQLEVACMLVRDRPFDTLWLERPLSFASAYDSGLAFVDTAATRIRIVRTDAAPPETVVYRMARAYTRVWLPDSNTHDTVRAGGRYRLEASVAWDAAREFPQAHAPRVDSLWAETYVQRRYAIRDTALVPIEALHPSLSLGLPAGSAGKALADSAALGALYDSLEGIRSLAARGITRGDLRRYLQGYPVLKPLLRGDSAYFIFDPSQAAASDANTDRIGRWSRQWYFLQDFDARDYGGLVAQYAYDTTGYRILDPLTQALQANFGGKPPDSANLFQVSRTRFLGITAKAVAGAHGYPDTLAWGNRNLLYAGRDVIYFYAVDSLYVEYQRSLNPSFGISLGGDGGGRGGGGGGGFGSAGNLVHYSNIEGGDGYFAAAAVDSFPVHLSALKDTFSVPALEQAWRKHKDDRNNRGF